MNGGNRIAIHAMAYVLFAVCLAAAPIEPLLLPLSLVLYLIGVIAQRGAPMAVVLRRFGNPTDHLRMTESILSAAAGFARLVWLEDAEATHPLIAVRRHTVLAFRCHLAAIVAMWAFLFIATPLGFWGASLASLYVAIGSLLIIETGVGNAPYCAAVYFVLSLALGASPLGIRVAQHLGVPHAAMLLTLIVIACAYLSMAVRHWIRPRTIIDSDTQLQSILRRPRSVLRGGHRLQSAGPALVDRVEVRLPDWRRVVSMLCDQAQYAIVESSQLVAESSLAWELEESAKRGLSVFCLCDKSTAAAVRSLLSPVGTTTSVEFFEYDASTGPDWTALATALHRFFASRSTKQRPSGREPASE